MQTSNLQTVKRSNRATVLNFIRQREPVSRRGISRELGLSPTTASAAVADLIDRGLVRESGRGVSTGGRRPIMLEINPKGGLVISVNVRSYLRERIIHAAALDLKSSVLQEIKRERIIDSNEAMLDGIKNIIAELVASPQVDLRQALAVGVSVPGLVNTQTGELVFTNINVKNLALESALSQHLQAPVFVQNSEDAAALGEYYFGPEQGCHNLVYFSVGEGIGAGIVIDGQIHPSGRISAGEIGHLTVQANGPLCRCGNRGCLSALVSSQSIVQAVKSALQAGYIPAADVLADLPFDELNIHQVMLAAQAGETLCRNVLQQAAEWVGIAVAAVINLLNPEVIVFGGELFEEGDLFFLLVEEVARRCALKNYLAGLHFARSTLGHSAGLKGASALAMEALFKTV